MTTDASMYEKRMCYLDHLGIALLAMFEVDGTLNNWADPHLRRACGASPPFKPIEDIVAESSPHVKRVWAAAKPAAEKAWKEWDAGNKRRITRRGLYIGERYKLGASFSWSTP